jgi:menaquinone-dependent protoporphyrinogen oxidase
MMATNTAPERILVTYASRTGSTAGVAEAIARELASDGSSVDVKPMSEVASLAGYSAVVAGSAIQGGEWLPEAMNFLRAHQRELAARPFAAFLTCLTASMGGGRYMQAVGDYLKPVRVLVHPVSEGLFAGTLDIKRLPSFADRLKFRLAVLARVWREGDHRDWQAIHEWGASLNPLLTRSPS